MPNKRKVKRQIVRARVQFGRDEPTSIGHSFNISPKGIGIVTNRLFPKNAKLNCNIYLNNSRDNGSEEKSMMINTQASVVWVKPGFPGQPSKMGIKILDPSVDLTSICSEH